MPRLHSARESARSDDHPAPRFSASDVSVVEGNAGTVNADFTVTLTGESRNPITVDYATVDGTAVAGTDYIAASGTLTFEPGAVSKTITIAVMSDTAVERNESFLLKLSNATGGGLADAAARGTVVDDDQSSRQE